MPDQIDLIDVKVNLKVDHGFTPSGDMQFKETVNAFSNKLLQRAKIIGECDRTENSPLEVTHEAVELAAHKIFAARERKKTPSWVLPARILEYVCVCAVGAGGSNLNTNWGIWAFVIGAAVGAISIMARKNQTKED